MEKSALEAAIDRITELEKHVRALTHWAARPDEDGRLELDGLPDGHAFEVVWGGNETDTAFTAGQVRRAMQAVGRK